MIVKRILIDDATPVEFDSHCYYRISKMLKKVLIIRGEIALRIIRACKDLKIPTVAIHQLLIQNLCTQNGR